MTTRDRILAAATDIFASDGLEGLSIRIVARRAGLSPMGLYRHFQNKDALVDALMRDGLAAWEARAAAINEADPVACLEAVLAAYMDFALDDPNRFNAAFLLRARRARKYPDDFAAGRSPVVAMVVARIEEAQAAGRIVAAPAQTIALALAALAQGLVSMERAGRFAGEAEFRALYQAAIGEGLRRFTTGAEQ